MNNTQVKNKTAEYIVYLDREIYSNDGFHIYVGELIIDKSKNLSEEVSLKVNGFELSSEYGKKIIVGDMGLYQGKKTIQVHYEKHNYEDPEIQEGVLLNIRGVGYDKAKNIMDALDNNIFNILKYEDSELKKLKIKGFGRTKNQLIFDIKETIENLKNDLCLTELQILLHDNLKSKTIANLAEIIPGIKEFKETPYQYLIDGVELNFKKADEIALTKLYIDKNNPERLNYLIEQILNQSIQGNTYIEYNNFIAILNQNNIENTEEKVNNNKKLVVDENRVYSKKLYEAETLIPKFLNDLNNKNRFKYENIEKYIKMAESEYNIKHDESQIKAIKAVVNSGSSLLIGGAGTGKTTVLKTIIYVLKHIGENNIKCVAPTGKASRRMEEGTNCKSTTIHSYLYQENYYNDVLIIDEFSMCDLYLLYQILYHKDFGKIIFVGDDGQLPSVQPGNNLFDMIQSNVLTIARLTKTHRQKGNSNILDVAYAIRENKPISIKKEQDFFFQECNSTQDFYKQIDRMYLHLKNKYDDNELKFLNEVQFIAPLKKGNCGCNKINEYIQKNYNYNKLHPYLKLKIGDKIMNIKNNAEKQIFNGEVGIVKDIGKSTFDVYFSVLDRTIEFNFDERSNFILAYAATIHKLQGSEYPYIVMIIESNSFFLDSRILYTGITRGKKSVIVLSKIDTFNSIAKRNNNYKRFTRLKERLIENIGNEEIVNG